MAICVQVSVSLTGLWASWRQALFCTKAGISHLVGAQYLSVKWMNAGEEKKLEELYFMVKLGK